VLARETITIGENETAGELHDRMMDVGARLVLESAKPSRQAQPNLHPSWKLK
jgi:methionyl-tRNA formyltransferase